MADSTFDLVIRGGTVVDGSGGEPYEADVAIRDGIIGEIGAVLSRDATIVSGQITYRHGEATGALPGRLVRGAR